MSAEMSRGTGARFFEGSNCLLRSSHQVIGKAELGDTRGIGVGVVTAWGLLHQLNRFVWSPGKVQHFRYDRVALALIDSQSQRPLPFGEGSLMLLLPDGDKA